MAVAPFARGEFSAQLTEASKPLTEGVPEVAIVRLQGLLKQNLTLTLNVIDLYDTSVPADISKNDLQIRSLLGIKF